MTPFPTQRQSEPCVASPIKSTERGTCPTGYWCPWSGLARPGPLECHRSDQSTSRPGQDCQRTILKPRFTNETRGTSEGTDTPQPMLMLRLSSDRVTVHVWMLPHGRSASVLNHEVSRRMPHTVLLIEPPGQTRPHHRSTRGGGDQGPQKVCRNKTYCKMYSPVLAEPVCPPSQWRSLSAGFAARCTALTVMDNAVRSSYSSTLDSLVPFPSFSLCAGRLGGAPTVILKPVDNMSEGNKVLVAPNHDSPHRESGHKHNHNPTALMGARLP